MHGLQREAPISFQFLRYVHQDLDILSYSSQHHSVVPSQDVRGVLEGLAVVVYGRQDDLTRREAETSAPTWGAASGTPGRLGVRPQRRGCKLQGQTVLPHCSQDQPQKPNDCHGENSICT